MEPEELLKEILRERAVKVSQWQKIKRWWKNRCVKCGAKRVIGLISREWYGEPFSGGDNIRYFKSPICEWCTRINFPIGQIRVFQEKSKMLSKEGLTVVIVLWAVLFLGIRSCQQIKNQNPKTLPHSEIRERK